MLTISDLILICKILSKGMNILDGDKLALADRKEYLYLKRTVDHDNILMNELEACSKSCNAHFVVPLYGQPIFSYRGSDIELYEGDAVTFSIGSVLLRVQCTSFTKLDLRPIHRLNCGKGRQFIVCGILSNKIIFVVVKKLSCHESAVSAEDPFIYNFLHSILS